MQNKPFQQNITFIIIWKRFIPLWLTGLVPAYFLTSYFSNFYPASYQFILFSLVFQILCGLSAYFLLDEPLNRTIFHWRRAWTTILVLSLAVVLDIATIVLVWQFPGLFHRQILFMDPSLFTAFAVLTIPTISGSTLVVKRLLRSDFQSWLQQTPHWQFIQHNLAGLLLTASFFLAYFIFTQCINFPGHNTVDQFFDTDISEWLSRLVYLTPKQFMARAVHPAILLFLRPLVELISIFMNGDKFQAVFLLNALTGASCVFLTWLIAKHISENTTFSLIMAFLLGMGTPHLLLSSMIETYIYSAFALILFAYLMQSNRTDLKYTVPVGVLVFGITITNLIQTCIMYIFTNPRLKVIIQYVAMILAITVILNMLQVQIYEHVMPIYDPASLIFEQKYGINYLENSWLLGGRFWLMVRAILLYAVVAPKPFILTTEIGSITPTFSVFKITIGEFHVAGYTGISDFTVKVWMVMLFAACILFLWNLFKSPRQMTLPLALAVCMGFNLILHTFWGDDPMLYSPDWAYALVLFVASSFHQWAAKKWLHLIFIIFLGLMMYANLGLIQLILQVSLPFYGN
jgi:hypothetical protein